MIVEVNQPYRIKIKGLYRTYNPDFPTTNKNKAKIYQGNFEKIAAKISKNEGIQIKKIEQELIEIVI